MFHSSERTEKESEKKEELLLWLHISIAGRL